MKNLQSQKIFQKAQDVLVGGVNSPVRSFKAVGGNPLIMKYGRGATLYDVDQNAYDDYCLSWGALILGHANRNAILAAKKTAENGASFGTTTKEEVELAEFITSCVPSIEKIRFVNSGTEATMSAIRLARGFTQKEMLVKFDGCYHGHFDDLLAKAGSGVAQLSASSSLGIPKAHIENTLSLPFNDIHVFKDTIAKHKDKIACVIIEPVAGNMGVIPATKEFLQCLRDLTKQNNIVLIFDEIMTGFRTQIGCAQADYGIVPDMTCLGKIIGGGFPVGAYGGRRAIMDCLAPLGGVYQAGTFAGNPVVMKAGLASLKQLNKVFYSKLNQKCLKFYEEVSHFLKMQGIDAHLSYYHSMMSLRFRKAAVHNYADAQAACGGPVYAELFQYLLRHSIYWPPADLEAFFVSGMHSSAQLGHLKKSLQGFFTKK